MGVCNKQLVHTFEEAHTEAVKSMTVTPDTNFIMSDSGDKTIKIWDVRARQLERIFQEAHSGAVNSVPMISDSSFSVSAQTTRLSKMGFTYYIALTHLPRNSLQSCKVSGSNTRL